MDSPLIFYAIQFASAAHAGQYRKGSKVPYLIHPLRASKILIEAGCEEPLVVAAMLHDTVEDCFVTYDQISRLFGAQVATLVRGASEPDKEATWEQRKQHTLDVLESADEDLLLVSVADKLDNIRSVREDLALLGEAAWSRFKRGRTHQRWYYESLAALFSRRLTAQPGAKLAAVFAAEVASVFPNS